MDKIYLSRRNLLVLLSKLDRKKNGEETKCTIIKPNERPSFKNSMDMCEVIAVEDEEYYKDFDPGIMHPADDPNNK